MSPSDRTKGEDLAEFLRTALATERRSMRRVAQDAGVSEKCLYNWRRGDGLGNMAAFLNTLEACGFELTLRRVKPMSAANVAAFPLTRHRT